MEKYRGALYQQDIIDEMQKQHDVFLYGLGFDNYDEKDNIKDVVAKSGFDNVDFICVGHGWLHDKPGEDVDKYPHIKFNKVDIFKILILNKEYSNLDKKLEYIKKNKFDLIFTHHHEVNLYREKTGVPHIFWPFGVNHHVFKDHGLPKDYDLTFTGILRNPTFPDKQRDTRIKIQKKLFYSIGEVRLFKKKRYRKYNFFWHGKATSNLAIKINRVLHKEKKLPKDEYLKHLNRCKICINTLSPIDLIGCRYYEAMASKSFAFCEEADVYQGIFEEDKHYVSFKPDLSNFDEKLFYYLENDDKRQEIVENAYEHILKNHTWEERIRQFIRQIENFKNKDYEG